jgi:hypothetical protein
MRLSGLSSETFLLGDAILRVNGFENSAVGTNTARNTSNTFQSMFFVTKVVTRLLTVRGACAENSTNAASDTRQSINGEQEDELKISAVNRAVWLQTNFVNHSKKNLP